MIGQARVPLLVMAALAALWLSSCYQAITTHDNLETNLLTVTSVQQNTQPQLPATTGNVTITAAVLVANNEDAQTSCSFPARLHPASQLFLDSYIAGRIATHEFLRVFSLPNSDYIPLAACFVAIVVDGIPMP